MESKAKPLLVWDGDCGFCRHWVERWKGRTGDAVDYVTAEEFSGRHPGIPPETFARSAVLVEPDGEWHAGAEAVLRTLAHGEGVTARAPLWIYERVPGVAPVADLAYRAIASHRMAASAILRLVHGDAPPRPGFAISSWIFLRLLGLLFLAAFVSLWVQVHGLVGSRGILPIAPFVEAARAQLGPWGFLQFPTACWWNASDGMLDALCGGGALLSLLLVAGVAPVPVLACLWACYLSLVMAGRTFLTFQWDTLLVETSLLALLAAPLALLPRGPLAHEPSRVARWLLWWLVFRLHFMSGVVKLRSGDPTWRDLTALAYHQETQPLPTWIGWHAHQMPLWFHRWSTAVMFVVELAVPFLLLAPRRLRHLACLVMLALQAGIFLTGNYGFFNLLTAALCLTMLDDAAWPAWMTLRLGGEGRGARTTRRWPRAVLVPAALVTLLLTTMAMFERFRVDVPWPRPAVALARAADPFLTFNGYGLFADMTTERHEIVIEGSDDGVTWKAYELPHQPGDPVRRPGFIQPHMPRLDWRMWFAALGPPRASPWLESVEVALLEGRPEVLALFETNPFPDAPPRHLRTLYYRYRFTDRETRRRDGTWWRRDLVGPYARPVTLRR